MCEPSDTGMGEQHLDAFGAIKDVIQSGCASCHYSEEGGLEQCF
jgi:hypothetical protein